MAYQRANFQVDDTSLACIWAAHGLGKARTTDWAGKGMNNPSFVINDTHVVRFDGLISTGISRFHGEQLAYEYVRQIGIPCPEVVAIDDSKTLVPYDYMIMTKAEGAPVLDCWTQLTLIQQEQVATEAGRLLAMIHTIKLPAFGHIYDTEPKVDNWYTYIINQFELEGRESLADNLISLTLYNRIQALLIAYRSTFDLMQQPYLVHWDYHFGNLLQQNGKITAVLDFEWALGGDPVHDFNRLSEWEDQCPGSSAWVYNGYTALHPLQDDHEIRVSLYEILWFLTCIINAGDAAEADAMREKLLNRITWLEEYM